MFKDKLKLLREEHQLSQTELASIIYVSRSAVAKWEQGRGMPSETSLHELCKVFNVTEKELLNEKEQYIYTFDYKKEKILKTIIISLVIAIPIIISFITGMINIIEKQKPENIDYMYILPTGGPEYITLKLNEEYEIDWDRLGIADKFENFEIFEEKNLTDEENKHYVVNKNKIKVIKEGSFFVYGKATKKRWGHVISEYNGQLIHIYCYDENTITKINSVEDFVNINNNLNGIYLLNNNLDFSNIDNFQSIGCIDENGEITSAFQGIIINPYGYKISNITIKEQKENYKSAYGLINATYNAYIDGLIVENINIDATNYQKKYYAAVGSLIGEAKLSIIVNCEISGTVNGIGYVGGIVGDLTFIDKMVNCEFIGKVITNDGCAGGLVGFYDVSARNGNVRGNKVIAEIYSNGIAGKIAGIIFDEYYNDNEATCILHAPIVYEFGSIDDDSQIITPNYK